MGKRQIHRALTTSGAWLVPVVLTVAFLGAMALLLWLVDQRSFRNHERSMSAEARIVRHDVTARLNTDRAYLEVLADEIRTGIADAETTSRKLTAYLKGHPHLQDLRLVHDSSPATELSRSDSSASRRANDSGTTRPPKVITGQTFYTPPFRDEQDILVFEVHVSASSPASDHATLTGTYACDRLIRETQRGMILRHHQISLYHGNVLLTRTPAWGDVNRRLTSWVPLTPPGHGMSLKMVRYSSSPWEWRTAALALICVALVIGMAVGLYMLRRQVEQRRRAEEGLRTARDELDRRVRERTRELALVAEQRQVAEERARTLMDQLAHVDRMNAMGELAAGLAHELNQPLGAITNYAHGCCRILESGMPDLDRINVAAQQMAAQANRAGRIVHGLRDMTDIGTRHRDRCRLRPLLQEVVDLLDVELRNAGVQIICDVPEHLSPVHVDRIQIQQVVVNLIRNAITALRKTPSDQRLIEIAAGTSDARSVQLHVRDTGPGCDAGALRHMFEPFYSTNTAGMGIGLSISRTILEAHRGTLTVQRGEGGGLRFRMTLPTMDTDESDDDEN